jgi:hypothetical protein
MLAQIIAVLIGWTGLLAKLDVLFLIGGFVAVTIDVFGFLRGRLKPLLPLILYVIGYIVMGSWRGMLAGALVGNAMEVFTMAAGAAAAMVVLRIARAAQSASVEVDHATAGCVLGLGTVLSGYVFGIALIVLLIMANR